jgi:predicted DNA repair protein MutK
MPGVLAGIGAIGTVAMLWVGGSIIVHGLHSLGWHLPYEQIKHAAQRAAEMVGTMPGLVAWVVTAGLDGIVGLATGLALIPGAKRAIIPVAGWLFPEKS